MSRATSVHLQEMLKCGLKEMSLQLTMKLVLQENVDRMGCATQVPMEGEGGQKCLVSHGHIHLCPDSQ